MLLPHATIVAVADGENLHLFRNAGDESAIELTPLDAPKLENTSAGSGGRHRSSTANPDESRQAEDGFAASAAAWLNREVLEGGAPHVFVVADPRTLGELRRHYHKELQARLVGELARDLTGRPVAEVQAAVASA